MQGNGANWTKMTKKGEVAFRLYLTKCVVYHIIYMLDDGPEALPLDT